MVNQAPTLDDASLVTRPPVGTTGLVGKIRQTFFNNILNSVITLGCIAALYFIIPPILEWAFFKAILVGDSKVCRANQEGACWAFIGEKLNFIIFAFYPQTEQWRPLGMMLIFGGMVGVSLFPVLWRKGLIIAWGVALLAMFELMAGFLILPSVPTRLWGGLPLTLALSTIGLVLAFPIGILLALGRRSQLPVVKLFCVGYIELIRGVPLITILFMSSLMFPLLLPEGMTIDKLLRAQVALIMFAAAYLAEVVRGGLQAISRGQYEAADSLGLGYGQKMRMIILPQALKIVIPSLVNTFIGFFKDTTLVIIIGLFDFLNSIKSALTDPNWLGYHVEAYVFAAVVYFVFCFGMSRYSLFLESKLSPEKIR